MLLTNHGLSVVLVLSPVGVLGMLGSQVKGDSKGTSFGEHQFDGKNLV